MVWTVVCFYIHSCIYWLIGSLFINSYKVTKTYFFYKKIDFSQKDKRKVNLIMHSDKRYNSAMPQALWGHRESLTETEDWWKIFERFVLSWVSTHNVKKGIPGWVHNIFQAQNFCVPGTSNSLLGLESWVFGARKERRWEISGGRSQGVLGTKL